MLALRCGPSRGVSLRACLDSTKPGTIPRCRHPAAVRAYRTLQCVGAVRRVAVGAAKGEPSQGMSAETSDLTAEAVPQAESRQQQQAYTGVPEYPVPPPTYQPAAGAARGGLPYYVWILVGFVAAKAFDFASKLFKGGPGNVQGNVQSMMMEQMMKQMMKGGGPGGMPGMPGMGDANAPNPFANPGANPFAGFGSGGGFPPSGGFPGSPAYDTTASPPKQQQQQSPTQSGASSATAAPSGQQQRQQEKQQPASAASAPSAEAQPQQQQQQQPKKKSAFIDVDEEDTAASASSSGGTAETPDQVIPPPGMGFPPPGAGFPPPGMGSGQESNGAAAGEAGGSSGASNGTMAMLERMMGDENMQKMLYPYLPEPMRNPETFKWMLSNPEYKKQLETMITQQTQSNPMMGEMASNFDYDSPEVRAQLESIGMTPDQVLQKIMADPELAMAMNKPEVQAAIMDVTQNQQNITKYANNEEVMKVFNKMSMLFSQPGDGM